MADDIRRDSIIRREIGPDWELSMDANQCWDVGEAIAKALAPLLGIGVATGEHCQNHVHAGGVSASPENRLLHAQCVWLEAHHEEGVAG